MGFAYGMLHTVTFHRAFLLCRQQAAKLLLLESELTAKRAMLIPTR